MIKFGDIINENVSRDEMDTPMIRNILARVSKSLPDTINRIKSKVSQLSDKPINDGYINESVYEFLENKLFIDDYKLIRKILLLLVLNPNVKDFKTEKLNIGENIYVSIFKYTGEDYDVDTNQDWVDCDECYGRGTLTCGECGGSGSIECSHCDGSGEETTTDDEGEEIIVPCEECDGSGDSSCNDCDGDGVVECDWCNGNGGYDDEHEIYRLEFIEEVFLSFEPLDINYDTFHEIEQYNFPNIHPLILWSRYINHETSSDDTSLITEDPDTLISKRSERFEPGNIGYEL